VESFTGAIIEQNRVTNRIPDSGVPNAPWTVQVEVQTAWLAVPFEYLFVQLKRSGQELPLIADDLLHIATQFIET
jgi:hypothetical protein